MMAPLFPAIFLGGPPHSGKSTLTYRLSQALRQRNIAHYALRASPDGEGDWSFEASSVAVVELRARVKGPWTIQFAESVSRATAGRHLPLLVDAGGVPSSESELIAASCSHALLLADTLADLPPWHNLVSRRGLILLAELQSDLDSIQIIINDHDILRGIISGLAPGQSSDGSCFTALVDRVARLFAYAPHELYQMHLTMIDLDCVIDVERPIYPLPAHTSGVPWQPEELPTLLAALPNDEPLGVYGRGPVWLYGALAALNPTLSIKLFDVRCGWIAPPELVFADEADGTRLRWEAIHDEGAAVRLKLAFPGAFLEYIDAADLPIPRLPTERGVILDGKLPNWLFAALAQTYAHHPWIAIYQPRLNGAVVIHSTDGEVAVGSVR